MLKHRLCACAAKSGTGQVGALEEHMLRQLRYSRFCIQVHEEGVALLQALRAVVGGDSVAFELAA